MSRECHNQKPWPTHDIKRKRKRPNVTHTNQQMHEKYFDQLSSQNGMITLQNETKHFMIGASASDKHMLCGSSGARLAPTIIVVNNIKKVDLSFVI